MKGTTSELHVMVVRIQAWFTLKRKTKAFDFSTVICVSTCMHLSIVQLNFYVTKGKGQIKKQDVCLHPTLLPAGLATFDPSDNSIPICRYLRYNGNSGPHYTHVNALALIIVIDI